jgi:hypothetical protein
MDLPTLIVLHGTAVWITALAVLVLAAVLGDAGRRIWADRRAAAVRRDVIGLPTAQIDGEEGATVTLRGVLEAGGALCPRFEDGAPVAAACAGCGRADAIVAARADRLRIRTRAGVVTLDGPVELVVGEVETRTGLPPDRLDAAVRARIDAAGGVWVSPDPVVLRSVRAGAEVFVRGAIHRDDEGGAGGYRTGGAFRLSPPGAGVDLRLAYAGVPRAARFALRTPLTAAVAGVAIFGLVFVVAPELNGYRRIDDETLAAVLAATPLHRARAVAAYTDLLDAAVRRGPVDPARFERLLALRLAEGRAGAAVSLLLDHGQWQRAEDLAVRSGLPVPAARAAFEQGAFDRAARLWDEGGRGSTDAMDLLFGLRVHLLAGDVHGARAAAHRAAEQLFSPDLPDLGCVAWALDAMEGDASARAGLEGTAPHHAHCAALLADLDAQAGRPPAACAPGTPSPAQPRCWCSWWPASGWFDKLSECFPWERSIDPIRGPGREPPRWALVRSTLEELSRSPAPGAGALRVRALLAGQMTTFESVAGEHDEAIRWARVMLDVAGACNGPAGGTSTLCDGLPQRDRLEAVYASVLLRAGRVEEAKRVVDPYTPLFPSKEAAFSPWAVPVALTQLDAAARRDTLETALWERWWSDSPADRTADEAVRSAALDGAGMVLAVLMQQAGAPPTPYLRAAGYTLRDGRPGREALLAWLRWGTVERCHGCDVSSHFDELTARLALAEELGDAALVAEIRPIVARFRAALLRRATAVPLLVLEDRAPSPSPPSLVP